MDDRQPHPDAVVRSRRLITLLDDDVTQNLLQSAQMIAGLKLADMNLVKALHFLPVDDPAYAVVFASRQNIAATITLEEGEELRQKGVAGLFEQLRPTLRAVVDSHPKLLEQVATLTARLDALNLER